VLVAATEDPSSKPWPHWVLRYIGANNQQAYWDAVTSVGGSPPWGGIGYDEAGAVYNLLEQYMGPSRASDSAYNAVAAYLAGRRGDSQDTVRDPGRANPHRPRHERNEQKGRARLAAARSRALRRA
jgi:hypothetical protein